MVVLGGLVAVIAAIMPASAAAQSTDPCPNAAFRTGPSANLPDCRAYELVSLPDSAGVPPVATNWAPMTNVFPTALVTADGGSVMFQSIAGAMPGMPGNGLNDRYLATRTAQGWSTEVIGPISRESEQPNLGGMSSDNKYYFVETASGSGINPDNGSLVSPNLVETTYLHLPDGSFDLLGQGSLRVSPNSQGNYISPGASHVIFTNTEPGTGLPLEQLEPDGPAAGTQTVYDRSPRGPTETVSLLPGDVTPPAGEDAWYKGSSFDGELIAFLLDGFVKFGDPLASPLYVRVHNSETQVVTANPNNTFAGIRGGYVFYADALTTGNNNQTPANLLSYDTVTQTTDVIANTGDARFVNVSDDGSRVYFTSISQINGEGAAGQPNLYVWERGGGSTSFIASVSTTDVSGTHQPFVGDANLAAWAFGLDGGSQTRIRSAGLAQSRTTPDGSTLVFQSTAQLTGFDNAGTVQIYRYDASTEDLACLSCVGSDPATGAARLQTFAHNTDRNRPLAPEFPTANLSRNGETVVFEAETDLAPRDNNGEIDVYRWSQGEGLSLISTGKAPSDSYLYAVTPDASDIMFTTPQDLVPIARNGSTRALYSARVNGGFPRGSDEEAAGCVGDACQGSPGGAPATPGLATQGGSAGNLRGERGGGSCRRAERRARKSAKRAKRLKHKTRKLRRRARKADFGKRHRKASKRAARARKKAKRKKRKARNAKRALRRCEGGSR